MADTTTKKRDRKEGKEEREHKSQKRHRHEDANGKRKHKKRKDSDAEDEGMWVEKNMDATAEPLHISSKELNTELKRPTEPAPPVAALKAITPGGPGSSWRMTRLRRAYETAEEEDRPIDEVAIERFGSLEAFEQAKEERRILNEREGRRGERAKLACRSCRRDNKKARRLQPHLGRPLS
ncbi:hypothetical protein EWM64_g3422 [Hericium alpestre]|uniref:Uncharacterized protein n=1 Tax=Hericium alpestre TaxID=135208 RepID=A0A4Z0A0K9_9AGAM|nr:hypothetical protein EWM64_g3422 [Hericium alpestre]